MDGFKNIDIKKFRGIEHLEIDDFARVNVFLGHNNSGKSSVQNGTSLEALCYEKTCFNAGQSLTDNFLGA